MSQVIEFPPVPLDARPAVAAIVKICRELKEGESYRELRARMAEARLFDPADPSPILRFLGVGGAHISLSPFVRAIAGAKDDDAIFEALTDRLWELNPVLGKLVFDLLKERPHSPDEIYKQITAGSYKGKVLMRPGFEGWLRIAQAMELIRPLGIALTLGARGPRLVNKAEVFDLDDFLVNDVPPPEPDIPTAAAAAEADRAVAAATAASSSPPPASPRAATAPILAAASAASATPRWLAGLGTPARVPPVPRDQQIPISRFGGSEGFSDEILAETARRVAAWWPGVATSAKAFTPEDFGLTPDAWNEAPDELLYRLAVAAALVFRFDADRDGVLAAYKILNESGALADLYNGTMPSVLDVGIDARALMLASLVVRRCAEVPDLAVTLEQKKSAAEVFAALEGALGRGLFRIELFWLMRMLSRLGVIRHDDLGDYTAVPHRLVRDTLFRLGFLPSPYAPDLASLQAAARAARRMAGAAEFPEEAIGGFAVAMGCAYDCAFRKGCDVPCRERLD